jgi:hypothetical protein
MADLTLAERQRLAELLTTMSHEQALEVVALERGEWPGLHVDGKPEPYPPDRPAEPD